MGRIETCDSAARYSRHLIFCLSPDYTLNGESGFHPGIVHQHTIGRKKPAAVGCIYRVSAGMKIPGYVRKSFTITSLNLLKKAGIGMISAFFISKIHFLTGASMKFSCEFISNSIYSSQLR